MQQTSRHAHLWWSTPIWASAEEAPFLTTNQPAKQPLCFCEDDNHLILERSLLGSLSRLKEKDSGRACLFSPRLKVEDSDHALLCIVKMLNQQTSPHTSQHMSFLQEKASLKVSTKHVSISKDLTKRPNRLYTFFMSFLISCVLYIQLCIEQFLWILHMWMMIMAGGSSIDTSPKIGGG